MAQTYTTEDGVVLKLAGAYPSVKVLTSANGVAANGILFLVGEADGGPAFSEEDDLSLNVFGPDEAAEMEAKYLSGPLVDAMRQAVAPSNDPDITGSPSGIYVIKTNVSGKAEGDLARAGLTDYGTLFDKNYGKLGNLIHASVTNETAEVAPETGSFTYVPGPETGGSDGSVLSLRVNGGAKQNLTVAAQTIPSTFVGSIASGSSTGLNSLSGILGTGGIDRAVLTGLTAGAHTLAVAVSSNTITITLGVATAWSTTPSVGDTLIIPATGTYGAGSNSVIKGGTNANYGVYVVTGATATTITATKLVNATSTSITAPEVVGAVALSAGLKDFLCFSPANIKVMTGTDRSVLTGLTTKTVTGTASGTSLLLTLESGSVWAATPQVNDYLFIPSTAPSAWHASGVNGGWYLVTAATNVSGNATITATRLSNGSPASFSATAIDATSDLQVLRPMVDGLGKSLEIMDGAGNYAVSTVLYDLGTSTVDWLSTASVPQVLVSSAETEQTLTVSRETDSVSDDVTAGGEIALKVGYYGTTASMTINATTLTTSVTGGSGSNLSITLKNFKTLSSLAAFINAQTGYTCRVGTTLLGQLPVVNADGEVTLDRGTFNICGEFGSSGAIVGSLPGRVKRDANDFFKTLNSSTVLVQLGEESDQATSGLPEVQADFFLSGGTKGATTNSLISDALEACEDLTGNFVVPLFSRDATEDITDDLTDSSSTYTIDSVNALASAHVTRMSTLKERKNRQAIVSRSGTFTEQREAANNIANYRVTCTFQEVKAVDSTGTIKQSQPWMAAVTAAAMQAAAFNKSILFKKMKVSGVVHADGSFKDSKTSDLERAIESGLLVAQKAPNGGFRWNSDQTTYAVDGNFVYNSTQAVYAADLVALTTAQQMENAFIGKSLADVSASVALSYLKGIMNALKTQKLLVGDDEAPLGFRNAKVKIVGNAMIVSLEVKLATALVFMPIKFQISEVQSSAQQ